MATKDAIIRGLCAFYSTLRAKWHMKLLNDAMAAQHAVDQAVMADAFGVLMASIAEILGTDEKRLARDFRSWHSWIDGEEPFKLAVRGKIRSDKLPNEVANYITNEAWLDDSVTRPSESKLGGLLDPANRTLKARHCIHWLETKLDATYATICDLTLKRFPADYEFVDDSGKPIPTTRHKRQTLSNTLISNLKHYAVKPVGRSTSLCRYHMQWTNWVSWGWTLNCPCHGKAKSDQ